MDRIIRAMEPQALAREERRLAARDEVSVEGAIALGTTAVARMLKTPLMVTLTQGGFTARKVAALRAPVPLLAVTTQTPTFPPLGLVWGGAARLGGRGPGHDAVGEVVCD